MAYGNWEGKDASHPDFRALFTREALLSSEWYAERLHVKQARDIDLWKRHVQTLSEFLALPSHRDEATRLGIRTRLDHAKRELERVSADSYLADLQGTIGADPIHQKLADARSVRRGSGAKAEGGFDSRLAN